MSSFHKLRYYKDGFKLVEYCCVCSAEGEQLLEDCARKFYGEMKKSLDEKKPTAK